MSSARTVSERCQADESPPPFKEIKVYFIRNHITVRLNGRRNGFWKTENGCNTIINGEKSAIKDGDYLEEFMNHFVAVILRPNLVLKRLSIGAQHHPNENSVDQDDFDRFSELMSAIQKPNDEPLRIQILQFIGMKVEVSSHILSLVKPGFLENIDIWTSYRTDDFKEVYKRMLKMEQCNQVKRLFLEEDDMPSAAVVYSNVQAVIDKLPPSYEEIKVTLRLDHITMSLDNCCIEYWKTNYGCRKSTENEETVINTEEDYLEVFMKHFVAAIQRPELVLKQLTIGDPQQPNEKPFDPKDFERFSRLMSTLQNPKNKPFQIQILQLYRMELDISCHIISLIQPGILDTITIGPSYKTVDYEVIFDGMVKMEQWRQAKKLSFEKDISSAIITLPPSYEDITVRLGRDHIVMRFNCYHTNIYWKTDYGCEISMNGETTTINKKDYMEVFMNHFVAAIHSPKLNLKLLLIEVYQKSHRTSIEASKEIERFLELLMSLRKPNDQPLQIRALIFNRLKMYVSRHILSLVKPGFLENIAIWSSYGWAGTSSINKMMKMEQWKKALRVKEDDDYPLDCRNQQFKFERNKISLVELLYLKEMFIEHDLDCCEITYASRCDLTLIESAFGPCQNKSETESGEQRWFFPIPDSKTHCIEFTYIPENTIKFMTISKIGIEDPSSR